PKFVGQTVISDQHLAQISGAVVAIPDEGSEGETGYVVANDDAPVSRNSPREHIRAAAGPRAEADQFGFPRPAERQPVGCAYHKVSASGHRVGHRPGAGPGELPEADHPGFRRPAERLVRKRANKTNSDHHPAVRRYARGRTDCAPREEPQADHSRRRRPAERLIRPRDRREASTNNYLAVG